MRQTTARQKLLLPHHPYRCDLWDRLIVIFPRLPWYTLTHLRASLDWLVSCVRSVSAPPWSLASLGSKQAVSAVLFPARRAGKQGRQMQGLFFVSQPASAPHISTRYVLIRGAARWDLSAAERCPPLHRTYCRGTPFLERFIPSIRTAPMRTVNGACIWCLRDRQAQCNAFHATYYYQTLEPARLALQSGNVGSLNTRASV